MVERLRRTGLTEFAGKATVVAMFALLSFNMLQEFLRTGHITGMLLLASESLVGAEHRDAARALAVDAIGSRIEVRERDIVLDTVVIDETNLDHIADGDAERRVDYAFDDTTHADEGHLAFRQLGAQPISNIRCVFRGRTLLGELRRRGRRRRRFGALRHVAMSRRGGP